MQTHNLNCSSKVLYTHLDFKANEVRAKEVHQISLELSRSLKCRQLDQHHKLAEQLSERRASSIQRLKALGSKGATPAGQGTALLESAQSRPPRDSSSVGRQTASDQSRATRGFNSPDRDRENEEVCLADWDEQGEGWAWLTHGMLASHVSLRGM